VNSLVKNINRIIKVIFLSFLVVSFTGNLKAASFADTHGISAYGMSMGNAMSAIVDDWSSVYYNIAGLGKTPGAVDGSSSAVENAGSSMSLKKKKRKKIVLSSSGSGKKNTYSNEVALQVGYSFPMLNVDISRVDSTTGEALPTEAANVGFYGPTIIGAVIDLNTFIKIPAPVSTARFGLVLSSNLDGTAVNVHNVSLRSHDFLMYGDEIRGSKIMAGLGFGFLKDMFGIGLGVNVVFGGDTTILIDKVAVSGESQTPYGESLMTLKLNMAALAGLYFNPGKIWKEVEGLKVGVSYSQENYMSISPMSTVAVASGGALTMKMNLAIFDYYQPHIVKGGISYSYWKITGSADVEYQMWSLVKYSAANSLLYADGLPELRDIVVVRLGIQYEILKWLDASCGYYWMPSVVPASTAKTEFNLLDNDKHVGSLGVKFKLPKYDITGGPIEISLAYQFQYLTPVTVEKDAAYITSENPDYKYGGMVHSFLLGFSMKI